jgi:hypothetical protein
VNSGLELKYEAYPDVSSDDLDRHFQMFHAYDLDSSGFISPENMLNVLMAMEVPDVSMGTVCAMMDEVAILTGHANDGKLTFRDFMNIVQHDRMVAEQEEASEDAAPDRKLSTSSDDSVTLEPSGGVVLADPATAGVEVEMAPKVEEPSRQDQAKTSQPEPEAPAERPRNRRSSFSALNSLASSRIKSFQATVQEASEREKLNAFQRKPVIVAGPMVNSDDMHMQSLSSKLQAFEIAATHKGTIERKKTWKKAAGAGNYTAGQKILLGGEPVGVAPKKNLNELP